MLEGVRHGRFTVKKGALLRGDHPAVVARPAYFLPFGVSDEEVAAVAAEHHEAHAAKLRARADDQTAADRARLAELDANRRAAMGRELDRVSGLREDYGAPPTPQEIARREAEAEALNAERAAVARRLAR